MLNPLWVVYIFFVGHPAGQLARLQLNDDTNPRLREAESARNRLNQSIPRPACTAHHHHCQFTRPHPRTRRPAVSSAIVKSQAPQYTHHTTSRSTAPFSLHLIAESPSSFTTRPSTFTPPLVPLRTDLNPASRTAANSNGAPHILSTRHVGHRRASAPGPKAHARHHRYTTPQ